MIPYYILESSDLMQEGDECLNQHPQYPFWEFVKNSDIGKKASKYHLVRREVETLKIISKEKFKHFKRNLQRLQESSEKIREKHRGKETTIYNYFGGYDLGYIDGQIKVLEDIIYLFEAER